MIAGEHVVESPKVAEVRAEIERQFGTAAKVVTRAPGRVNLIGDHTDYNDGFVMPTFAQGESIALKEKEA